MNKKFRKFISIFVITVFVLSIVSASALAAAYNSSCNSNAATTIWEGSNVPYAWMVSPDGTQSVTSVDGMDGTSLLAKMAVLEYKDGVYGKKVSDKTYKTYDYSGRDNTWDHSSGYGAFKRSWLSTTVGTDFVYEFSFAYESCTDTETTWRRTPVVRTGFRLYSNANLTKQWLCNPFFVSPDGFYFATESAPSEDKTTDMKDNFTSYKFEPEKWYSVSILFDAADTTDTTNTQYTHKAYINGELCATYTTTTPYYGAADLNIYPANGSVIYWDNIQYNRGFTASEFVCANNAAELASDNSEISVVDDVIEISDATTTIGAVKTAIAASVKSDETVRIYNSDYSVELTDEESASAIGTKLVVAQTRSFTTKVKNNESPTGTTTAENTYTYYDVVAENVEFETPVVTTDASAGKASGTVNMHNYTGEAQSFKGYLAVYNGTELAALGVADFEAEAADTEVTFSINDVPYSSGYTTKFFVWKADGITPELASK